MNTKQLRQQILSLAIQGKLVPQIAEEGTAKDLLQKIEAERKKSNPKYKPLSLVTDEEKPFEIPESWEWVRLNAVCNVTMGQSPVGSSLSDNTNYCEFHQGKIAFSNKFLRDSGVYTSSPKKIVEPDSLLISVRAPVGELNITQRRICIGRGLSAINPYSKMPIDFWYYILQTKKQELNVKSTGSTFDAVTINKLNNLVIPLPPLSEQKRIVEKLEDVLGEIDKVEQAQIRITKGAKQLQNLVLQTAIQGKLVPHIAEEGTAKDLLKQIEEEKAKLIKEGKLKKTKPLPEISDEEKPFEIPDSWEWVKIGDIFMHASGKQLSGKNQKGNPHKYITTSNLYWGRFVLENLKEMNFTDEELEKCSAQKGDLLVCEGGDIGRSAIWNYNYNICLQNHVHKLRYYIKGYTDFVFYVIRYYKNINVFDGKGIGIQGLSANVLKNIIIPLPPLAEQKRIVAKLEELLGEVEKLKK